MNTKPEAPGQWAKRQSKWAAKEGMAPDDEKKRMKKSAPQMEQSSEPAAQPMGKPAKPHGDKLKVNPAGATDDFPVDGEEAQRRREQMSRMEKAEGDRRR